MTTAPHGHVMVERLPVPGPAVLLSSAPAERGVVMLWMVADECGARGLCKVWALLGVSGVVRLSLAPGPTHWLLLGDGSKDGAEAHSASPSSERHLLHLALWTGTRS